MSGGGGGGGGGGGLFNDPLELALVAGTAIAAPYAAPLLFEGGALAGSTLLGAGVTGMGIGALGGAALGYNPVQTGLYGGLGGAAASGLGVGAATGATTGGAATGGAGAGMTYGSTGAAGGITAGAAPGSIVAPSVSAAGANLGAGSAMTPAANAMLGSSAVGGGAALGGGATAAGGSLIPGISNTALGVGAGGLGLMALMKQDQAKYGTPSAAQTTYTGGALQDFHYDPRNYTPLVPTPPSPRYQAQYQNRVQNPMSTAVPMEPYTPVQPVMAASGGLMQDKDFTAGGMYPGSQIDKTQYTSSPQMPMSMQATMADYDPATNPLTGEPTTHMAAGGSVDPAPAQQVYQPQYTQYASPAAQAAAVNSYQSPLDLTQLATRYGVANSIPSAAGLYGVPNTATYVPANPSAQQGLGAIPTPTPGPMSSGNTYNPLFIPHTPTWQAEQDRQAAEAAAAEAARKAAEDEAARQSNPFSYSSPFDFGGQGGAKAGGLMPRDLHYAAGGIANLGSYSDGGQLLKGPGDGMSDSIPAKIGRAQPARLADNEFVVPADVVSHLGNGSSDAGAKKLYAMMNNVRKARTGKKKQAPKINANKYLPA